MYCLVKKIYLPQCLAGLCADEVSESNPGSGFERA